MARRHILKQLNDCEHSLVFIGQAQHHRDVYHAREEALCPFAQRLTAAPFRTELHQDAILDTKCVYALPIDS